MRRVLAAAVLVAFMPTANAQDKGKADFSTNAEFRARWFWFQNPSLNEKASMDGSFAESRFKIGANYKANEKISAHATLLHNANFGLENDTDNVQPATSNGGGAYQHPLTDGAEDTLIVNEAYATWASSDDLSFKIGRQNYSIADGAFMSTNDWEKVPYTFEGVVGNWEQEWGKLQLVLFKVRNLGLSPAGTSASSDPEHNMYGINFDLKTMPEWLKAVNAHIFKDNSDAVLGGAGTKVMNTTNGLDTMRYGVMASFGFQAFDAKLNWEKQGGKIKNITGAGVKTEADYGGDMMQLELGYTAANFMGSRWFVNYHKDSGDDNTTDTDLKGYDSYYTDTHGGAGFMDILGWGNLTDTSVGWTMKPADKTDVGLAYHMFKRTESSATSQGATLDKYGARIVNNNVNDKADLGTEIDVWATHHYDAGLSTTAFVGMFTPGDYFTDDTNATPATAAGDHQNSKAMFVMIEGKATF